MRFMFYIFDRTMYTRRLAVTAAVYIIYNTKVHITLLQNKVIVYDFIKKYKI